MEIKLLTKYDTIYNADSVEWCPISPFQRLLVCGHYQLEEDKSNGTSDVQRERFGHVRLFEYTESLKLLQTIETVGVLDQKWCHNLLNGKPVLAVTTAQATLDLYTLEASETPKLTHWLSYKFPVEDKERLILSVDWSTGKYPTQTPHIVLTDSQGNVHLLALDTTGLKLLNSWHLHSQEAWIGAFDYWNTKCLFSGADDSIFIKTCSETGRHVKDKSHQCGVTSVHSNASREHVFATGSLDTLVRIWDTRAMREPLDEVRMHGPVWRLKWDPFEGTRLLAACMDGGVSIVETAAAGAQIAADFGEHKSLAYGVDWCHANGANLIASCSFYDNLMCVASY